MKNKNFLLAFSSVCPFYILSTHKKQQQRCFSFYLWCFFPLFVVVVVSDSHELIILRVPHEQRWRWKSNFQWGGNSFFKTLFWVQISKSSIYAKDSVESELQQLASHIDHQHIILGLNTVHRLTGILLLMFNVVVCYCIIMCCNCMYLLFGLHCCTLCAKLLIYHFCLTCHGLQMKSSLLAKSSIFTLRHSSVSFKYMYSSSKIQMFITPELLPDSVHFILWDTVRTKQKILLHFFFSLSAQPSNAPHKIKRKHLEHFTWQWSQA